MNYINLTDENLNLGRIFREVDINGEDRIDVIIAGYSFLCEKQREYQDTGRGIGLLDKFMELCQTGGQRFILLEISEDLLYSESDELQKIISWIQRETHYFYEIRGVCAQGFKKEQQINIFKYFTIFYPDTDLIFDDFDYIYCVKNYNINNSENKFNNIIDYIFSKIEENLL